MKNLFAFIGVISTIALLGYRLYWGGRSVTKGILKDNTDESVKNYSKSVNRFSLLLLFTAIVCFTIYKYLSGTLDSLQAIIDFLWR